MQDLLSKIMEDKTMMISTIVAVYAIIGTVLLSTRAGRRFFDTFRFKILYSETSQDKSEIISNKLIDLENKIIVLEKELSKKVLKDKSELIDSEINKYLDDKLKYLIEEKISSSNDIESSVLNDIENKISIEVKKHLLSTEITDIISASEKADHINLRCRKNDELDETINYQLNNAGKMKTVMINLFIIFNLGLLLVYIFAGSNLTQHAIYAITGLYVSLATFIIYIYRTSNVRTSVLLALREDGKKFYDAIQYLEKHKKGTTLTNTDVELIKLLLTNRSEREKMSEHPYEVILKGVANSNIQFKGGKMSLKEEKGK